MKFDSTKIADTLDYFTQVMEARDFTKLELAYLAVNLLLVAGETAYDRDNSDFESVRNDYKTRRTLGGLIICFAHVLSREMGKFLMGDERSQTEEGWESALTPMLKEFAGRKAAAEWSRYRRDSE